MSNVYIWDVPFMTAMVSFTAQTCAVPPRMKESAYRTFILSSVKASACIVTAIQMAHKFLGLVTVPVKWLGVGGFSTPDWVV